MPVALKTIRLHGFELLAGQYFEIVPSPEFRHFLMCQFHNYNFAVQLLNVKFIKWFRHCFSFYVKRDFYEVETMQLSVSVSNQQGDYSPTQPMDYLDM